jgi:hypothetical protein
VTTSIENIPSGWRARETYRVVQEDEFIEKFDLADAWETIPDVLGDPFSAHEIEIAERRSREAGLSVISIPRARPASCDFF